MPSLFLDRAVWVETRFTYIGVPRTVPIRLYVFISVNSRRSQVLYRTLGDKT